MSTQLIKPNYLVNRKIGSSSPPGDVFCLKRGTAFAHLNGINLFLVSFALQDDNEIVRNIFTVQKVPRQPGEWVDYPLGDGLM